ncbi:uncharacterized protein SCHCODRAFT_01032540 [Schizophyllum commune H4-8]|uniref:Uncharacterized protein n=1 Tax=Schizophyllum commune (strain H4-8 / FGSC 9210) TaxID=578458 RepID=D8Q5B5_SCHCM|nr:uncharacterized protein SCHCODRAFT_01032540 [Schizophyllum commune H4-8]KAI5892253.1 hypothetical protein SCHCODRAFT_01032540 [Schizophyllum commune H4-8]
MKLSLAVIFSVVATSALAVPLFEPCQRNDNRELLMRRRIRRSAAKTERDRSTGRRGQWRMSPSQQKRSEVVESREEGAIKYPTWNKEDKRTDDARWVGANWSLEDKRTTEEYAIAHQWGHEDKRAEDHCKALALEARSAKHVLMLVPTAAQERTVSGPMPLAGIYEAWVASCELEPDDAFQMGREEAHYLKGPVSPGIT